MKKFYLSLLLASILYGNILSIEEFESDIYSTKTKDTYKIEISLLIEGRDIEKEEYKILDGLNIIISSFSKERLFTSKGKIEFKNSFKSYLEKEYGLDIDKIYLQRLIIKENSCDKLIRIINESNIKNLKP